MNKPSERIVVFVTPAQKRAIAASAEKMGISVSELMRRAVLSFDATGEQVKAAGIVDRLNTPRTPDALDAALQRVADGTRGAQAASPAALRTPAGSAASRQAKAADPRHKADDASQGATQTPLLPADVLAALVTPVDEEAVATADAVARVTAAKAAANAAASPFPPRLKLKRPRIDTSRDDDDPASDPSTEGGHFA